MRVIKVLDDVFQKHGIQESPIQLLLLAELKATQTLILNAASVGNEEVFRSMQQTLSQDVAEILLKILDERYGPQVANDLAGRAFPQN